MPKLSYDFLNPTEKVVANEKLQIEIAHENGPLM